jgi:ABC-type multidrug transport system fused ATPase/permease subunit
MVYVIEDGRVTEQGSPEELVRSDGWFSRFIRSAEEPLGEPERAGRSEAV